MGHVGKPDRVLREVAFLQRFVGRGLLELMLGCSLISMDGPLEVTIIGGLSCAMGLVSLGLACPCFSAVPGNNGGNKSGNARGGEYERVPDDDGGASDDGSGFGPVDEEQPSPKGRRPIKSAYGQIVGYQQTSL